MDGERTLARAAAAGDSAAFAVLTRQTQSRLRGFLLRMTRGDASLADDLAQETYLTAFRKIRQFGTGSFFGWLCAIAYSQFLMHARKHRLEQLDAETEAALPDDDAPVPETGALARIDLERAMAQLSPPQRAALTLCFALGQTHEEAAATMNIPVGTLKSHISRGRERLAGILQAWRIMPEKVRVAS